MSEKLSQATIDLLRKVEQHILAEPRRLDMSYFGRSFAPATVNENLNELPPCGTMACIAGWSVLLSDPEVKTDGSGFYVIGQDYFDGTDELSFESIAANKLGLTEQQGERLFYFKEWSSKHGENGWPEEFSVTYNAAENADRRARITVERIEHFIATDGRE